MTGSLDVRLHAALGVLASFGGQVEGAKTAASFTNGMNPEAISASLGPASNGKDKAPLLAGQTDDKESFDGVAEGKPGEATRKAGKEQLNHERCVQNRCVAVRDTAEVMGTTSESSVSTIEGIAEKLEFFAIASGVVGFVGKPLLDLLAKVAVEVAENILHSRNNSLDRTIDMLIADAKPAAEPGNSQSPVCHDPTPPKVKCPEEVKEPPKCEPPVQPAQCTPLTPPPQAATPVVTDSAPAPGIAPAQIALPEANQTLLPPPPPPAPAPLAPAAPSMPLAPPLAGSLQINVQGVAKLWAEIVQGATEAFAPPAESCPPTISVPEPELESEPEPMPPAEHSSQHEECAVEKHTCTASTETETEQKPESAPKPEPAPEPEPKPAPEPEPKPAPEPEPKPEPKPEPEPEPKPAPEPAPKPEPHRCEPPVSEHKGSEHKVPSPPSDRGDHSETKNKPITPSSQWTPDVWVSAAGTASIEVTEASVELAGAGTVAAGVNLERSGEW